jgi:D-amino-acid dehydrogenase
VGGGVIGTTTAYYLHADGHEVVVVDREPQLATEASFANGGMLHASHTEPWNTPAAIGQLLRWIGREKSPLLLRPSQIPNLLGWGMGFFRYSLPKHHYRNTRVNARLAVYSIECMRQLRHDTGIAYDEQANGILKIFHDSEELAAGRTASERVRDLGVRYQMLDTAGVIGIEPTLDAVRGQIVGGIYYPDDEIGDPCLFTRRLGDILASEGAELRLGEAVTAINRHNGAVTGVTTDHGTIEADAVVLAAGSEAVELARPLGIRLPIRPVKGYSATVDVSDCDGVPTTPIIDAARKVVVTALGQRLRVAGTAEFAGLDRTVNDHRVRIVLEQALANFPQLASQIDYHAMEPWACLRPMTMDGPAILGETPVDGLYLNTGSGHLGWTFAAGAGRAVADRVVGRTPAVDIEGLKYARFGR